METTFIGKGRCGGRGRRRWCDDLRDSGRRALAGDGQALSLPGAGFAVGVPLRPLGAGLADDGAGCADEEAVVKVRVAQVSRLGARRLEGFGTDAALQRGDVTINAPVLISGRCGGGGSGGDAGCGRSGDGRSGGRAGGRGCCRQALPRDWTAVFNRTTDFALVIPEEPLGARALAEDLVTEADEESVVGVRIAEVGAALAGGLERLCAGATLQWRNPALVA